MLFRSEAELGDESGGVAILPTLECTGVVGDAASFIIVRIVMGVENTVALAPGTTVKVLICSVVAGTPRSPHCRQNATSALPLFNVFSRSSWSVLPSSSPEKVRIPKGNAQRQQAVLVWVQ